MVRKDRVIIVLLTNLFFLAQGFATPHYYCEKYIEEAAKKTGVLPEIIWAVAKAESNWGTRPWPWTINIKGKGYYFPNKAAAEKFLKTLPKKVRYQTDVGCMQVNWGYHGTGFSRVTEMLNPRLNILYAAYFLKELYQESGRWAKAVASYHSRKWSHGGKYANRVAHLVKDYEK